VKLADFLNNFSSALSQHKTAMEKLQDAINDVNTSSEAINTAVSSFNDLDLSEFLTAP
jgi:hypothetical protein